MTRPPIVTASSANAISHHASADAVAGDRAKRSDPGRVCHLGQARRDRDRAGIDPAHSKPEHVMTTANQATGRQRRDGRRPLGNSKNANSDRPAGKTRGTTPVVQPGRPARPRQPARDDAPLEVQRRQRLPRHQHPDQQKNPADPVTRLARNDDRAQQRERHRQHDSRWLHIVQGMDPHPVENVQHDHPDRARKRQRTQRPRQP